MWLISGFFLSYVKIQTYQDQVFQEKCCNASKKQNSTLSNIKEGQANRSLIFFHIFARSFLKNKSFQILYLTTCVVHGFSTECLKTSREFSLLFENTTKASCCFIISFRLWTSLYVSIIFRSIYFSLYKVKLDGKTNLVLNWPEIYIILSARYISVGMSYLLWP